MWCDTCGFLVEACRSAQLERCADCNGPIVEGYCDCDCDEDDYDDADDDVEDLDDCDCDCCTGLCEGCL